MRRLDLVPHPGRLPVHHLLLAGRGITRLSVDGGPEVAAAFVAADLFDEAVVARSSKEIATDGIDSLGCISLAALIASRQLRLCRVETIGSDSLEFYQKT